MSHSMYDRKWQSAMEQLSDLVFIENPDGGFDDNGTPIPAPPVAGAATTITREAAFRHFGMLYIRYVQVFKDIQACYDQIVHPQKRRDIRIALDATMTRLLQVKKSLSMFDGFTPGSDYVHLDAVIDELKMTPYDLELPVPAFFRELNDAPNLVEARNFVDAAMEQYGLTDTPEEVTQPVEIAMPSMTLDDAIRIIQKNERGRQGRCRGRMVKALADDLKKRKIVKTGEIDPVSAVLTLQRWFRGMLARIRTRAENARELRFLGMVPSRSTGNGIDSPEDVAHDRTMRTCSDVRSLRRQLRKDNENDYVDQLESVKKHVENVNGPEFREKMWIERYEWWIQQKERTGIEHENFDEFYQMKNPPPVTEQPAAEQEEPKGKKGKGDGKKDKKDAKKDSKKDAKGDVSEVPETIPNSVLIGPTAIVGDLFRCVKKYTDVWAKLDESNNFKQTFDHDLAVQKVMPDVVESIRKTVDEQLMSVLENLKLQIQIRMAEESKKSGKKGKKGAAKKGKGGKKGKSSKKGDGAAKAKKCCDGEKLLGDQSIAQCIDELVRLGIVKRIPNDGVKTLDQFIVDFNYLGHEYESASVRLDPSLAQIRSTVVESCILPLGSQYVKENSPLCNAVLFYGPPGSGKTMLSRAIAYHTNAMWFDLSASALEKKLGTTKQEVSRLVHMVFHVAKQSAPSVIYIDHIEKLFAVVSKKKAEASAGGDELQRIKKDFLAHRDSLTAKDRVLIIGNTVDPTADGVDDGELKSFFKSNGKMIFCPFPDYATRLRLWKTFITNAGVNVYALIQSRRKFEIGTLAYISQGYTAGSIQAAVQAVLPPRRVAKITDPGKSGIVIEDFITVLSKMPYTFKDMHARLVDFTEDITGVKQRKALQAAAAAAAGASGSGEDAASTKKKKKK
ncbi:AAA+ ATPase domain-containing protein [Plasmodiophora brassicae]